MTTPLHEKSSLSEIATRFDNDVERFSDLNTGQVATIDAPLAMELITAVAIAATAGGEDYRKKVFDYIDKEDSPRPVTFQLDLMRKVGFQSVDLLHKNSCFSAFGGVRDK